MSSEHCTDLVLHLLYLLGGGAADRHARPSLRYKTITQFIFNLESMNNPMISHAIVLAQSRASFSNSLDIDGYKFTISNWIKMLVPFIFDLLEPLYH